jgi:hypothetical protein
MILNTSRAQYVSINLYNIDNIPLAATYTSSGSPIDLTDYKFEFILSYNGATLKTYLIDSGSLTTEFLSKTGTSINVLNMEAMFEDIRTTSTHSTYKLIQVVTDPDNNTYVHIIYSINAKRY